MLACGLAALFTLSLWMGYRVLSYETAEGVVHMSTVLHPVEYDNATATGFETRAGTCISSATLPLPGYLPAGPIL